MTTKVAAAAVRGRGGTAGKPADSHDPVRTRRRLGELLASRLVEGDRAHHMLVRQLLENRVQALDLAGLLASQIAVERA